MKRSILLALCALSGSASFAATLMIADFDNQNNAANPPVVDSRFWFGFVNSLSSAQNINVVHWEDLLSIPATGATKFNVSGVAAAENVPAGGSGQAYHIKWGFSLTNATLQANTDPTWTFLRCFSSGTTPATLVSPVIDLTKQFKFDVWSKESVRVALLISQAAQTAQPSFSGSGATPLDSVGGVGADALQTTGRGQGGWVIPAGQWTTVTVDWSNLLSLTFRSYLGLGLGTLNPTTPGLIALNSVMFTPLDGEGALDKSHDVYMDNFRMVDPVAPGVYGKVTLQDFGGDVTQKPVTIEIEDSGASIVQTETVTLAADGTFSFATNLPDGTYSAYAKASHWLRQKVGNVKIVGKTVEGVDFSLVNGDVDNDNVVTVFDYNALSDAFDTAPGDGSWNPEADLDGDDSVNVFDYNILSANFDKSGD